MATALFLRSTKQINRFNNDHNCARGVYLHSMRSTETKSSEYILDLVY